MFPVLGFYYEDIFKSTSKTIFVAFGLEGTSPTVITMYSSPSCSMSFTILS